MPSEKPENVQGGNIVHRIWLRQSLYRGLKQKRKTQITYHDSTDPGLTVSYTTRPRQTIEYKQYVAHVARSLHQGAKKLDLAKKGYQAE
jgi:hypothetical protein